MFERYTEGARRAIFFARFAASESNSPQIEPPHLLLGLLREDTSPLRDLFGDPAMRETIRRDVEALLPSGGARSSTSVDLPLSPEAKRALHQGMQEADRIPHRRIGCLHLTAGLLMEPSPSADVLKHYGVDLDTVRAALADWRPDREEGVAAPPESTHAARTAFAMGGGQHSSYRLENDEMVIETNRTCFGHRILITERVRKSADGRTLVFTQHVTGPGGKTARYIMEFDLPE